MTSFIAPLILGIAIGIGIEWSRARYCIRKAKFRRWEFRAVTRNPIDLEPCEFTGHWLERSR